jgi:hypothetical protein
VYTHPDLIFRLHLARQNELHRAAAAYRRVRAIQCRRGRREVLVRIRHRLGWWLIERGLHLVGTGAPTAAES